MDTVAYFSYTTFYTNIILSISVKWKIHYSHYRH